MDKLLTDEQRSKIQPLLPKPKRSRKGGRPLAPDRPVFEGILWVLRSGTRWKDLPKEYLSLATCWRRLKGWEERGVWLVLWRAFLAELDERDRLNWEETFAPGEKRGSCVGCTRKGKGTKWMVVGSGEGVPLGIHLDSAAPAEVKLIGKALDNVRVPGRRTARLIADKGYDSDPLRRELAGRAIDLIAPNRRNRGKTQDGRKLRRYGRRRIIERTMAWLGNFRRLVVRYEHRIEVYRAFFHIACALIALGGPEMASRTSD